MLVPAEVSAEDAKKAEGPQLLECKRQKIRNLVCPVSHDTPSARKNAWNKATLSIVCGMNKLLPETRSSQIGQNNFKIESLTKIIRCWALIGTRWAESPWSWI